MLQLNKASTDGVDVALLAGETHTPRTLGVLQLRICVDGRITHVAIETVHNVSQLSCTHTSTHEVTHNPLTMKYDSLLLLKIDTHLQIKLSLFMSTADDQLVNVISSNSCWSCQY